MNGKLWLSAAFLFAAGMGTNDLCGQNYSWFTDTDMTSFEDEPGSQGFNTGDTLYGVVRSNGQIMISGSPVFYDLVMSSATDFLHGEGYDPQFRGPPPMFGVTPVEFPDTLELIRRGADHYFPGWSDYQYRLRLEYGTAFIDYWPLGVPFDSSNRQAISTGTSVLFFDAPLEILGTLDGELYVGSSHDIRIIDDVRYACVNLNARDPRVPSQCDDYLVIASEGSVKIGNTTANGRENSGGLGRDQTNLNFTDVRINAHVFALNGSFTFEDQNDPDSGYVCECAPDERGKIWLAGRINQRQRGFVHRSNNEGTGYVLKIHDDYRWTYHGTNVWSHWPTYPSYPESLNFGDVATHTTAWDTLVITCECSMVCFGAFATGPFFSSGPAGNNYGDTLRIPVSFTPSRVRDYSGTLTIYADFGTPMITLTGRGVIQLPATDELSAQVSALSLSVHPNPFNAMAEIRLALPEHDTARLVVYDRLGRVVRDFGDVGSSTVNLDASGWSSGLYFARAHSRGGQRVVKLLMLK